MNPNANFGDDNTSFYQLHLWYVRSKWDVGNVCERSPLFTVFTIMYLITTVWLQFVYSMKMIHIFDNSSLSARRKLKLHKRYLWEHQWEYFQRVLTEKKTPSLNRVAPSMGWSHCLEKAWEGRTQRELRASIPLPCILTTGTMRPATSPICYCVFPVMRETPCIKLWAPRNISILKMLLSYLLQQRLEKARNKTFKAKQTHFFFILIFGLVLHMTGGFLMIMEKGSEPKLAVGCVIVRRKPQCSLCVKLWCSLG